MEQAATITQHVFANQHPRMQLNVIVLSFIQVSCRALSLFNVTPDQENRANNRDNNRFHRALLIVRFAKNRETRRVQLSVKLPSQVPPLMKFCHCRQGKGNVSSRVTQRTCSRPLAIVAPGEEMLEGDGWRESTPLKVTR